jgi:hypothetical protein
VSSLIPFYAKNEHHHYFTMKQMSYISSRWPLLVFTLCSFRDIINRKFFRSSQSTTCQWNQHFVSFALAQDIVVDRIPRCDPTNDTCPFQFNGFCDSDSRTECKGGDCWDCDSYVVAFHLTETVATNCSPSMCISCLSYTDGGLLFYPCVSCLALRCARCFSTDVDSIRTTVPTALIVAATGVQVTAPALVHRSILNYSASPSRRVSTRTCT